MNDIQRIVHAFAETHDLHMSLERRLLDLSSELGELAGALLKGTQYGRAPLSDRTKLKDELGDVAFSLLSLANELGEDLNEAVMGSLRKYEHRFELHQHVGSQPASGDEP
jgi:NTP pyrophosphatase (non-canonical NTP hydrolase)